ncbi:thiamine pyrophosphate-dependent enzyme [Proteiniclasticum ruminis]|uniref:Indolepyruvate oxidoreductase subunit IorA n=1 Tax=Proteiniclasticum ruminis TaxID=398199 RepID=A0A1G8KPW4_9CLOT|nr:thiamine pyrophosphate-dependent enzyme [Proteiniclasticum ruminis]SDI44920.1 indolepyruvate ferredoxin oxidoreductase alpha subunit [Proteiniclasticum ruminis]
METTRKVMTGNEAAARGFYEAGGLLASSYPGSPTVELLEAVKEYKEIYAEFSVNEKVALEVAIGSSFYGARSMVSMKHVGVNVAMDPLMTFTQTPTQGGFVLVTGDDPGMASSQNEQDNRIIGKFANMGILYPGSSQEVKDSVKWGLTLSEQFEMPFMVDVTSRVCHGRGIVTLGEREEHKPKGFTPDNNKFTMLPPITHARQYAMKERLEALAEYAYDAPMNLYHEVEGSKVLLVATGLVYENLRELQVPYSIYRPGLVYPLSARRLKELREKYDRIIVIEEMMPFIENELKLMGIHCEGKEWFSFTGEQNSEEIEEGLLKAGLLTKKRFLSFDKDPVVVRPPMFCSGCPHRPVFDILKKMKVTVMGDIGCYSMSVLPAFEASHSMISMGATVGITKGMNKIMRMEGSEKPLVSVIGDGTFFHSGMTGFANLLHQLDEKDNMTFIVLENGTTAMTGGQQNGSSGKYDVNDDMHMDIKAILNTMGIDNVQYVDQFDYKLFRDTLKEEVKKKGISVIIATRPCALKFKIKEPHYYVDPNICIGCRSCVKTNCPPIRMKEYKGIEGLKSFIDPEMCVGCSVCSQVCPVGAIKPSRKEA